MPRIKVNARARVLDASLEGDMYREQRPRVRVASWGQHI